MTSKEVVVGHRLGLHARASARLVRLSESFSSDISLSRADASSELEADARSILSILLLAAVHGTRVRVRAEGDDEKEAVDTICEYLACQ
jgi:phosphocarrier protein